MGTRFLSAAFATNIEPVPFREIVLQAFQPLGGVPTGTRTGFALLDAKYGISFQSWVKLTTNVVIQKLRENNYEVQVYMNWGWGTTMWIMLVLGLILGGFPLLFWLLYLLFDPVPAYQQAINRIYYLLEPQPK